ncbi:hypothetical protein FRC08_007729, partial [Ceratobasidium sp. 394]
MTEQETWVLSTHFRQFVDNAGRALPGTESFIFQHRLLCDAAGRVIRTELGFRDTRHEASTLRWVTASLLFEKRTLQAGFAGMVSFGAGIYEPARNLVEFAEPALPGIRALWDQAIAFENGDAPEAPLPSAHTIAGWHPAIQFVVYQPYAPFDEGRTRMFPRKWLHRDEIGHAEWSVDSLLAWIKSRPCFDRDSGWLLTGHYGLALPLCGILLYAFNMLQVSTASSQDPAPADEDLQLPTPGDWRVLARCVELLAEHIDQSSSRLAQAANFDDRDSALGFNPVQWIESRPDGSRHSLDVDDLLVPPLWNVFDAEPGDMPSLTEPRFNKNAPGAEILHDFIASIQGTSSSQTSAWPGVHEPFDSAGGSSYQEAAFPPHAFAETSGPVSQSSTGGLALSLHHMDLQTEQYSSSSHSATPLHAPSGSRRPT